MPKQKKIKEDTKPITRENTRLESAAGQDHNEIMESAAEIEDVIIQSDKGIVTRSDIDRLTEEYIDISNCADRIYKDNMCFNGMLYYIYKKCLYRYTKNGFRYDYKVLDSIFDNIYVPMCALYSHTPNIYIFYNTLCGISNSYITMLKNTAKNGISEVYGNAVNKDILLYIKKWDSICEGYISDTALSKNSIGAIFHLKAKYAWTENNTLTINANTEQTPKLSIDQLDAIGDQTEEPQTPEDGI